MMKKRIPAFLSGCLTTVTALALGTTVLAASGQVTFNFANVSLDGETKITAGTTITAANGQEVPSSILYTDAAGGKTNYLPIRAISELLDVEIGYDSATKTVLLGEQNAISQDKYWQRTVDGTTFTYTSQRPATPYTTPPAWHPTWLPEGWKLAETFNGSTQATFRFTGGDGRVNFICAYPDKSSIGSSVGEELTIQNCRQVSIQGYMADLYVEDDWKYLVWEGQDGILFWFSGNGISTEDLTKMAESVEPTVGELPQYQLSWMPDGYTKYEQSVLPTTVQEIWVGPDNTSLTLLYSTETVEVPEGAAETVEVNGVDAQYWAAEEPYEPSDSSMTVNGEEIAGSQAEIGGVTVSTGTIAGPNSAGVSTLAWTDSDTGLFFRLHGTVSRDTLLHVAESITAAGEAAGD